MTYNLPVFEFTEGLDNVCSKLAEDLLRHFKSKLAIKINPIIQPNSIAKENKIMR